MLERIIQRLSLVCGHVLEPIRMSKLIIKLGSNTIPIIILFITYSKQSFGDSLLFAYLICMDFIYYNILGTGERRLEITQSIYFAIETNLLNNCIENQQTETFVRRNKVAIAGVRTQTVNISLLECFSCLTLRRIRTLYANYRFTFYLLACLRQILCVRLTVK